MPSSAAARSRLLPCLRSASLIRRTSASALLCRNVTGAPAASADGDTGRPASAAAPAARTASGRSRRPTSGPAHRATARSTTLRSSRTLPGQR